MQILFLFFCLMPTLVLAQEDNVQMTDAAFGEAIESGTMTIAPTVNEVYKIDNAANKKVILEQENPNINLQENINNESSSDSQNEDNIESENKSQPYLGGYRKRSLEEIQENLKLPPQELLDKIRKERQEAKEAAAKQPIVSSQEYNNSLIDAKEARREERRNMTKEERRAIKEELKILYKARRDERRNMTKAERRKIKEEMKAKEKARREQQKEERKERKKMRDMD